MTIEDNMNQSFEDLSYDDMQKAPATPPFHIVLVDIKKAAFKKEICCVEVPLELDKDLQYVALSYRWGELSETMIDTELGYTASITSFALDDFYALCRTMLKEKDLQKMKYIWVDAICVDQTDYERRKATIHHMSTIYESANYVVPVPDLHLEYLRKTAVIKRLTDKTAGIGAYIYNILLGHGERFLGMCASLYLRVLYIDENQGWDPPEPEERGSIIQDWENTMADITKHIPVALEYLSDLVTDWASRVWVISEYHIAKSKHKKMKYWFLQLDKCNTLDGPLSFFEFDFMDPSFSLTNDFNKLLAKDWRAGFHEDLNPAALSQTIELAHDAHQQFHTNMITQVAQQNVIEMMLKSKASKAEDRLYAVLPVSKYKSKLQSMSVDINHMMATSVSIRLKLFELLDLFDKLALLFISCNRSTMTRVPALPTFVTSTIEWRGAHMFYQRLLEEYDQQRLDTWNFDFCRQQPFLTLMSSPAKENFDKLDLKPKEYYVNNGKDNMKDYTDQIMKKTLTIKRLGLDDPAALDWVLIPFYVAPIMTEVTDKCYFWDTYRECQWKTLISLVGSFKKNKWILSHNPTLLSDGDWELRRCIDEQTSTGFYIY